MGPAVADAVTPDVLSGLKSKGQWHQPEAGVGVAHLARHNRPWFPAVRTGTETGALRDLGPVTVRRGAAALCRNRWTDRTTAQRLPIDKVD